MIISAIVVLVVLMAGCGTAIAVLSNRSGNVDTPAGILASPSPGGTPGTPAPVTPGGTATSNKGVAFKVPAGWTVNSKDDQSIAITNPKGDGSVTIGSGTSSPSQTAEQNKETIDRFFAGKYPDTRSCSGSKTTRGALNGAQGISWEACFTLSAGGQSIQAEAKLFAGANSNGSVYYVVILLTPQSNIRRFVTETAPILQSVQWKLT